MRFVDGWEYLVDVFVQSKPAFMSNLILNFGIAVCKKNVLKIFYNKCKDKYAFVVCLSFDIYEKNNIYRLRIQKKYREEMC
jgi:hypothetical protein